MCSGIINRISLEFQLNARNAMYVILTPLCRNSIQSGKHLVIDSTKQCYQTFFCVHVMYVCEIEIKL